MSIDTYGSEFLAVDTLETPTVTPICPDQCSPRLWEPFAKWIQWWFCNQKYTPMAQIIVAFVWGVLLSPWSSGLFFLLLFIIVYEILYYVFTHGIPPYYNLFIRTGIIYSSIFGYILGRTLSGDTILEEGVPTMPGSQ